MIFLLSTGDATSPSIRENVPLISQLFQYLGISNNMPRRLCFLSGLSLRSRSDGDSCLHSSCVEPRFADALPRSFATASLAMPHLLRRRAAALSNPSAKIRLLLSKLRLRLFRKPHPGETSSLNKGCDRT